MCICSDPSCAQNQTHQSADEAEKTTETLKLYLVVTNAATRKERDSVNFVYQKYFFLESRKKIHITKKKKNTWITSIAIAQTSELL